MTSHYLKDICSSLLNYTRPDKWLDLEFIFTEKDRWTIFNSYISLGENKPFQWEQEEDYFVDWIVGQFSTDEEFFMVQLQKHCGGCTVKSTRVKFNIT